MNVYSVVQTMGRPTLMQANDRRKYPGYIDHHTARSVCACTVLRGQQDYSPVVADLDQEEESTVRVWSLRERYYLLYRSKFYGSSSLEKLVLHRSTSLDS